MITRIIASVTVVLALSAGVAYAAVQLTSSDGTQVCVNNENGLMRVASTCRDSEYPIAIGGGTDIRVTQNGTFTVPVGQTVAKTLPLTGITVTGLCERVTTPTAESINAKVQFDAASGQTMDIPAARIIGGQTWTTQAIGGAVATGSGGNTTPVVASSNGATATIVVSPLGIWSDQSCAFLWQATEAPN